MYRTAHQQRGALGALHHQRWGVGEEQRKPLGVGVGVERVIPHVAEP